MKTVLYVLVLLVLVASVAAVAVNTDITTPIDIDFDNRSDGVMVEVRIESGPYTRFTMCNGSIPNDYVWRPNYTVSMNDSTVCVDNKVYRDMMTMCDGMVNVCQDARNGWGILANMTKDYGEKKELYGSMKVDREFCYSEREKITNQSKTCAAEKDGVTEELTSCQNSLGSAQAQSQLCNSSLKKCEEDDKKNIWIFLGCFLGGYAVCYATTKGFKKQGPSDERELGGGTGFEGA